MGIRMFGSSHVQDNSTNLLREMVGGHLTPKPFGWWNTDKNPDPAVFEIKTYAQFQYGYVLEVNYPNCTNYEGNKVLVYLGHFVKDGHVNLKVRDPHFFPTEAGMSPLARFEPSELGLRLAKQFAFDLNHEFEG